MYYIILYNTIYMISLLVNHMPEERFIQDDPEASPLRIVWTALCPGVSSTVFFAVL